MKLTEADKIWIRWNVDHDGCTTAELDLAETVPPARERLLRREAERRVLARLAAKDRRDARRKRLERHLIRLAVKIDREEQAKMRQPTHGPGSEGALVVIAHEKEKLALAELKKWLTGPGDPRPHDAGPLVIAGRAWLRAMAEAEEARKRERR